MSTALTVANELALLSPEDRASVVGGLTETEQLEVLFLWALWARPNQQIPGLLPNGLPWSTWLILAGRGYGKTRTGAETVRNWAQSGDNPIILLAGPTSADVRDTMVEGESGILAVSPPWFRPKYQPSKRRLVWPNGTIGILRSADQPNRFRGPQYFKAWVDELAAWRYAEAWDQIQFGLRLGNDPQAVVTTTPRPTTLIRELAKDATTYVTRGSTFENSANLAQRFIEKIRAKYEGTRLGRQELHAELLEDNPGALWTHAIIEQFRVRKEPATFMRVGIGVDPAVTAHEGSDETGIVVAGVAMCGCRGPIHKPELHGFVLEDLSDIYSPDAWAQKVATAFRKHDADRVIAEINKGGDLVVSNIRTAAPLIPVSTVRASRGKYTRAEPVAALYEQGKVHHVGTLPKLEDQLTDWNPAMSDSPDRLDALVWVLTALMLDEVVPTYKGVPKTRMPSRRM